MDHARSSKALACSVCLSPGAYPLPGWHETRGFAVGISERLSAVFGFQSPSMLKPSTLDLSVSPQDTFTAAHSRSHTGFHPVPFDFDSRRQISHNPTLSTITCLASLLFKNKKTSKSRILSWTANKIPKNNTMAFLAGESQAIEATLSEVCC